MSRRSFRGFLCGVLVAASLVCSTGCAYVAPVDFDGSDVSELSVDDFGFVALKDIPAEYISCYAGNIPGMMGYDDYVVDYLYHYVNDAGKWVGYVATYVSGDGLYNGYATIDFSQPVGHWVSEFAFGTDAISFDESYSGQMDAAYVFDGCRNGLSTVKANMPEFFYIADNPSKPFGLMLVDAYGDVETYSSIMNGDVLVDFSYLMLSDNAFSSCESLVEKHFLSKYEANPSASLIDQDYILDITKRRYACPFAAAICMLRQEGCTGGYSDERIFRWFWIETGVFAPYYDYDKWDGLNYDKWPESLKTWMKEKGHMHFYDDDETKGIYAISGGCTAKEFLKKICGQGAMGEHENSWLGKWVNAFGSTCEYLIGWLLVPDHFTDAVDQNKPSIFLYSRKYYDEADQKEEVQKHAVNVVGYMYAPYYYDAVGAQVDKRTLYIAVANGWKDDTHYYMDITNAKYLDSGSYDTMLQVYTIVR